ncbi:hypothetical protein BC831DRAFT_461176 [Entophlyctis helioformis]|nr:hypothetical protein BC831DRAFT_461176 [Entophlyctis helioformis]
MSATATAQQVFEPSMGLAPKPHSLDHALADASASTAAPASASTAAPAPSSALFALTPGVPRTVVCIDSSPYATATFDWAFDNVAADNDELVLLHIVSRRELSFYDQTAIIKSAAPPSAPKTSPSPYARFDGPPSIGDAFGKRIAEAFAAEYMGRLPPSPAYDQQASLNQLANDILDAYTVHVESADPKRSRRPVHLRVQVILSESPKDAVCDFVNAIAPRSVVVGSHSRPRIQSLFVGSTAMYCLAHCAVPVIMVPSERIAAAKEQSAHEQQ